MSEGNKTLNRQFVQIDDVHASVGSASNGEDNLQFQLFERKLSSSDIDGRIIAIFAPLATHAEKLTQSVKELSESNSNRTSEGNVASERSRSSPLHPDMVTGAIRQPRSGWQNSTKPFDERRTQYRCNTRSATNHTPNRRLPYMDRDDAFDDDLDAPTGKTAQNRSMKDVPNIVATPDLPPITLPTEDYLIWTGMTLSMMI